MTLYLGAANVSTALASGITSGQTSVALASSANLPASITAGYVLPLGISHPGTAGVFEIVYVTAISGTTLTVTRGEEGTTAQAWAAGDLVFSEVTADMLQNAFAGSSDKTFLAAPGTTGNEVVNYGQLNAGVFGGTTFIFAYAAGTVTVAGVSNAKVPYDTVSIDQLGEWNPSTYVFTPQVTGWYEIRAAIQITCIGYLNLTDPNFTRLGAGQQSALSQYEGTTLINLGSGVNYQIEFTNQGGSSATSSGGPGLTFMSIRRVR